MTPKLICPHCRIQILHKGEVWACDKCGRVYPYREGVLSFLEAQESFNPTNFEDEQEAAWTTSAQLRDRIRSSKLLSFLNWLRIHISISGRRDRIFYKAMHRNDSGRLILDIGCGGGRHYFCDYGTVIGIDPVLELLQIAKTIYSEVYHASAFALPFGDNTFDYVVSSDVIGHISNEDKDRLFSEMYRVLKPGGRTVHVIETDADNIWLRYLRRNPAWFKEIFVDRPGHIGLELPSQLRNRFLRAGFKQVRFEKFVGTVPDCGFLSACFDNEIKNQSRILGTAVFLDRILASHPVLKEATNVLLEPASKISNLFTSIDDSHGTLVVFEK